MPEDWAPEELTTVLVALRHENKVTLKKEYELFVDSDDEGQNID